MGNWLDGVTVTPYGNRTTTYNDWSNANLQERELLLRLKDLLLINEMITHMHQATDKAAKIGIPIMLTAATVGAAPMLNAAIETSAPYVTKGLDIASRIFRPSTWVHPTKYTNLFPGMKGILADNAVNAGFIAHGVNTLNNLHNEGTLSISNPETVMSAMEVLPLVEPISLAGKIAGKFGNNIYLLADRFIASKMGLNLDFNNVKSSQWYWDVVSKIGLEQADALVDFLSSLEGIQYLKGGKSATSAAGDYKRYNLLKDLIAEMPESSLLGGSAALSALGTVERPSIGFHDADFNYQVPGLKSLYLLSFSNLDKEVPALFKFVPKLVWRRQLFPVQGTTPNYPITRRFTFKKDGMPIDIFLGDKPLPTGPRTAETELTPANRILDAKLYWTDRYPDAARVQKDVKDLTAYKPYGPDNLVIDPVSGKSLFSPMLFEGKVTSAEGYPNVSFVETYPGSGERVPVIMNWKGLYKPVGNSSYGLIKYYGPTMGKTTAAKTNQNLVDFDDIVRNDIKTLANNLGISVRLLKMQSGNEYKQLLLDAVNKWKTDSKNKNKTLVISNAALAKESIFNNTPQIPTREVFIKRQVERNPDLNSLNRQLLELEAGKYYDDLISKWLGNYLLNDSYVSELESISNL